MSGQRAKPRSRRLLVLWAVALALLLAVGLSCWLVMVPYWQVRAATFRTMPSYPSSLDPTPEQLRVEVARLGGQAEAARRLCAYVRLPDWLAPCKSEAAEILAYCGRPAVQELRPMLTHRLATARYCAATALGKLEVEAVECLPNLERLRCDPDSFVRRAATDAVQSIRWAQEVEKSP